jgi:hypothetical protein
VLVQFSARGKASGLEIGQIRTGGADLFHVPGGRARRVVLYLDRERALADLGLAPDVPLLDSRRARVETWREVYEGWASDS